MKVRFKKPGQPSTTKTTAAITIPEEDMALFNEIANKLPPGEGMREDACAGYALGSRLRCAKCGGQPKIVKAEGTGPVSITVACCGGQETRILEKSELTFTQYFFEGQG